MFCLICMDKPGHLNVRLENRNAHINYVLSSPEAKIAGPFVAEDGETMIGTMLVLDIADRDAAEQWAAKDPYALAGLFDRVEIHPWKHLLGGLPKPDGQ